MTFDPETAKKSFRGLEKSLKVLPKQPTPKRIHNLRTYTRRVEAIVHALMLDRRKEGKRLLKALESLRKKDNKVRDMDVLIGFAATLSSDREDDCLVQLIEYLGFTRLKAVRDLRNFFSTHRRQIRHRLKQCSVLLERKSARKYIAANREWSVAATATILNVGAELSNWPRLRHSNLHSFRLKVKELRYMLELAKRNDEKLFAALTNTKDKIGEWHDWNDLVLIASDNIIKHGNYCPLKRRIHQIAEAKLKDALSAANTMRMKYQDHGIEQKLISLSDKAPHSVRPS